MQCRRQIIILLLANNINDTAEATGGMRHGIAGRFVIYGHLPVSSLN